MKVIRSLEGQDKELLLNLIEQKEHLALSYVDILLELQERQKVLAGQMQQLSNKILSLVKSLEAKTNVSLSDGWTLNTEEGYFWREE